MVELCNHINCEHFFTFLIFVYLNYQFLCHFLLNIYFTLSKNQLINISNNCKKTHILVILHNFSNLFLTSISTFFKLYQKNQDMLNFLSKKSRTVLLLCNKITLNSGLLFLIFHIPSFLLIIQRIFQ